MVVLVEFRTRTPAVAIALAEPILFPVSTMLVLLTAPKAGSPISTPAYVAFFEGLLAAIKLSLIVRLSALLTDAGPLIGFGDQATGVGADELPSTWLPVTGSLGP